ncbi:MAG: hypothetical protein ACP5O3_03670 [Candidatus Micrarchaeia archaeon]|jgi:hypothetical protein
MRFTEFAFLFALLVFLAPVAALPGGASIVSSSNKTTTEIPSALSEVAGDEYYLLDLTGFTQTSLWAAVYGTLNASIVLASNDSSSVHTLISWSTAFTDPHYLASLAPLSFAGRDFNTLVMYINSSLAETYILADDTDLTPAGVNGSFNLSVALINFTGGSSTNSNFTLYFDSSLGWNCTEIEESICASVGGSCNCWYNGTAWQANGQGRDYSWLLSGAGEPTIVSGYTDPPYLKVNRTQYGYLLAYPSSSIPSWQDIQQTLWTGEQLDNYLAYDVGWSDNANHSFTYNNSQIIIGSTVVPAGTNSNTAAKTENALNQSVWETCALNDSTATPLFVSPLKHGETAYNNELADYQILLPNNQKLGGPATEYYFYLELR